MVVGAVSASDENIAQSMSFSDLENDDFQNELIESQDIKDIDTDKEKLQQDFNEVNSDEIDQSIVQSDDSILEIDDSTQKENKTVLLYHEITTDDYELSISDGTLDGHVSLVAFDAIDSKETYRLTVYVDDVKRYDKDIYQDSVILHAKDLKITSEGNYYIKVAVNNEIKMEETIYVDQYFFTFIPAWEDQEDLPEMMDYQYGNDVQLLIYLPKDAKGKLTVTANGKTYDVKYKDGESWTAVSSKGWKLGLNKIVVTYHGDSKYHSKSVYGFVNIALNINYPYSISLDDKEYIELKGPSGSNGNVSASLYYDSTGKYDEDDLVLFKTNNITINNGYGVYSLVNLPVHKYVLKLNYNLNNYDTEHEIWFDVIKNQKSIRTSVTPKQITKGKSVDVNIVAPKGDYQLTIYDNYKCIYYNDVHSNGKINKKLSKLSVGTHKIQIELENHNGLVYSKFFKVTVKPAPKIKLTIKTVKVKKSAKKLVLTATLKINDKIYKGKTITFKFYKKTLKAKTNKKGIAKVTVKKSILKKLKVGKKVKYQAKYGSKIVKKTAKVKR